MKRVVLCCLVVMLAAGLALAEEKRFTVPLEDSPSYGPADAPVTMIEFIDYQ
jgi:hypothetical protein